ncbi:MAG: Cation transport ATPase [Verrucomicrobiota bacterium]|jgi:Cu+-exporting ATPase
MSTQSPSTASSPTTSRLLVEGMSCSNCSRKVTTTLQNLPDVHSASVNLETGLASVTWKNNATPDPQTLLSAVRQAGFVATEADPADETTADQGASRLAAWKFNVLLGAFLTAPLIVGEWFLGLGHSPGFKWLGFACATPVLLVCGRNFFTGAWRQLQRGESNMDTLVSLGSSTAYAYSTAALLLGWPGHLYFMEAASIITLISAGHWLEALATTRAAGALRALMNLAPATARKQLPDGSESEVPVSSLQPGDTILLKPGDRIPTDGTVLDGQSAIDESMLTGESMPVEKSPNHRLYAGTLNQDGRLTMQVTDLGETTALARIIAVVQRAQNSRASIQRLADRVSNVFVPIVVAIALSTALLWGLAPELARSLSAALSPFLWPPHLPDSPLAAAIIHATAVLIVACPCAMGLATPAAIMAGANVAARRGILIRDGQALEKSGTLTAVAFDKTGTLTQGKLSVTADWTAPSNTSSLDIPATTLALAKSSHHPVSLAAAAWANTKSQTPLPVYAWIEERGKGLRASYSGSTLRLGSLRWLQEQQIDLTPASSFIHQHSQLGATVIGLSQNQTLLALLAVRDTLKPHAREVVTHLAKKGLKVFLLTGDQKTTAHAVARSLGIPETSVLAEIAPEHKADTIQQLQQRGDRVAFVGDGINDAPALEQADLGIAVARASDVARESADLILLNSDIHAIPEAIGLSQATLRTIRQNLFWAFFYNTAAIPLAALGYLSPVVCALAMGLSDLIVIGNALRLYRWKP